jgi:hypothetical protein
MKKPTNPIAIRVQPMAGRQLPADFHRAPAPAAGNFDQRNLSEMWKSPNWQSKLNSENVQNTIRGARLTSAPSGI